MLFAEVSITEYVIPRAFFAIAAVIIVARLMGAAARMVRQPPVVGEIIGGILMGPTLLGAFPGDLDTRLFPTDVRPFLTVVANLGLVIFMFIVGLELDTTLIKGKERIAGVISLSSIILPMTLGILLALYLYDDHKLVGGEEIKLTPFVLFIGASMSITAFPVLARILIDRGMYRTAIGALTLASAAVDDVLAWALLAIVLAVIDTGTFFTWEFPRILGLSILFAVVMAMVVRPLLARLVPAYHRAGRLTPNLAAVVLVGFLLSAFTTSEIGVHHILGAFTFGAMMPRDGAHALNLEILERLEQLTVLLLLPVFFVTTGLGVDIRALRAGDLGVLALIMLTACSGKFIGATVAARSQGIRPWRKAAAIGTLMNTRGLTELIILSIGREQGVLDEKLFTMLVVMAVLTTVITEPGLRLFYPDRMLKRDVADAARAALGVPDAYRVLVAVEDPAAAAPAVALACDLVGAERPAEVVLSRLVSDSATPELGGGYAARLAEMTLSIESMASLEAQVTATGVPARVLTRFSNEVLEDLAGQASATETDVVLLVGGASAGSGRHPAGMADETDKIVAVLHAGSFGHGAVAVAADDSDAGVAAFELGIRVARTRGVPLILVADSRRARRWSGLAERLQAGGLDARVAEQAEGASLLVVSGASATRSVPEGAALCEVFTPPDLGRTPEDALTSAVSGGVEPAPAVPDEH